MAQTTGTGRRSMRSNSAVTGRSFSMTSRLGLEIGELADVGADDEAALLGGDDDEAADGLVARALLHLGDDLAQLLERPAAERILALALAIELSPGDAPLVDGEAPVLEVGQRTRQRLEHRNSSRRKPAGLRALCRLAIQSTLQRRSRRRANCAPPARRRFVVRLQRGGIEVVDGDDAGRERFQLAQLLALRSPSRCPAPSLRRSSRCRGSAGSCPPGWRVQASFPLPRRRPPFSASPRAGRSDRRDPSRHRCSASGDRALRGASSTSLTARWPR